MVELPDFSTISPRQAGLDIHLPVRSSNEPVYVVDSSGLKLCGEGSGKSVVHPLLNRIRRPISALGGDGAYDTLANPPQPSRPVVPVIPPRWKQQSDYHRRSVAQAGVSRYRRIIGPKLQARTLSRLAA